MKIQTNTAANSALGYMKVNAQNTERSIQKLSSGFRINRAADDAAGLAIANKLRADSKTLGQAQKNAAQASAMLQIADGATQTLGNIFDRMRELASQGGSANVGGQGQKLQDEWNSLFTEADRIIKGTAYQGINVMTGLTAKVAQSAAPGTAAAYAGTGGATAAAGFASAVAQSGATIAANGTYTFTAGAAGEVTLTSDQDPTKTQTLTGVASGAGALDFSSLGIVVTKGASFVTQSGAAVPGTVALNAGSGATAGNGIASVTATGSAANHTYTLTSTADGTVTLTSNSDSSRTQTLTGVQSGAGTLNFATLGISIATNAQFSARNAAVVGTATGSGNASAANGFGSASVLSSTPNGAYSITSNANGSLTLTNGSNIETVTGVTDGAGTVNFATLGITITKNAAFQTRAAAVAGSGALSSAPHVSSVTNTTTGAATNGSYRIMQDTGPGVYKLQKFDGTSFVDVAGSTTGNPGTGVQTLTFGTTGISITTAGTYDNTAANQLNGSLIDITGGKDAVANASIAGGTITVSGSSPATTFSLANAQMTVSGASPANVPMSLAAQKIQVTGATEAQVASDIPKILVGTSASQGIGTYGTSDSIGLDLGSLKDNAILNLSSVGNFEAGGTTVGVNLTTTAGAQEALIRLDAALGKLNGFIGKLGAAQSRVDYAAQNVASMLQNTQAAESSIRDADMAAEMSSFTKNNILQQAAQSMLSQANQGTQGILQLLRG